MDSEPFWQAAREGRFVLNRCQVCRRAFVPPLERCRCGGRTAFEPAVGTGEIYSFIVVQHPSVPAYADEIPYVIALVELDEGARLPGRLLGEEGPGVEIGQRVIVEFIDVQGTTEPAVAFRLVSSSAL